MPGRPLHSPICPTLCFQEDTRAQRQRLQKHLAEHLRQTWGRLGPPPQVRDLGELLQAWGAGARTATPKGSRFTHSEKFTFHLVSGPERTWGMLARRVALYKSTTLYPHSCLCSHQAYPLPTWGGYTEGVCWLLRDFSGEREEGWEPCKGEGVLFVQTPAFPRKFPLGVTSLLGWSPRGALIFVMGSWGVRDGAGEQELCQGQGDFFMSKHSSLRSQRIP